MKFRTEVEIPISEKKIQISDSLFSIGSCFATEISVKLADSQFQTLNNPFGTLFNPWAVKNSIQEIFENKINKDKFKELARDIVKGHGKNIGIDYE